MENGKIYGTFIDPILKPMRKRVVRQIQPNEKVIDVACGTGAQVFEMAKKAIKVVGIDYSESMIKQAKKSALKGACKNVQFVEADATNLSSFSEKEFDVSTLSLALHQFSPEFYTPILSEMKRVAKKIIIIDYSVPLPKNYAGFGSRVAEFLAGAEHNKNFKQYYKLGGLNSILPENNLQIDFVENFANGAFQLVVCSSII